METYPVVTTDILVVGAGPSGLSMAIHLADLIDEHNRLVDEGKTTEARIPKNILVLEKASAAGNHNLSGAVIRPEAFRSLFPGMKDTDFPFETAVKSEEVRYLTAKGSFKAPMELPYFGNHGNYLASLGKVVRWMAEQAEKRGVQIFPGFSADEVLMESGSVRGVRTGATGIDKEGRPMDNYQPPTDVRARITLLAEGTRGSLTKKVVRQLGLDDGKNPQVYSLGVKEIWEVPEGNVEEGFVAHTMGYPLASNHFGGGFIYGLHKNLVAIGLVAGLDHADPGFDTHHAFQVYKKHPYVANILKGGKILRYGAKTIPEGGLFAVPKLYHDNLMIAGDSAGLVAMPALKGIHLAVQSGMLAAQTAFEALKSGDTSQKQLSRYEQQFRESAIYKELYPVRNFRQAFQSNIFWGMLRFGTQILTGGRGLSLSGRLSMAPDYQHTRPYRSFNGSSFLSRFKDQLEFDKVSTFDKEMDIFFSGTKHDEEQPSHIQVASLDTCLECVEKYNAPCERFCPAQVFEIVTDGKSGKKALTLHPSNCVHCKTCDIKDPYQNVTWATPYGADGPEYANM